MIWSYFEPNYEDKFNPPPTYDQVKDYLYPYSVLVVDKNKYDMYLLYIKDHPELLTYEIDYNWI